MSYTEIRCEQRSAEWFQARCGRVTSSLAADCFRKTKSGYSTSRRNALMRLALERVCGKPLEKPYQSEAMKDGIEREQAAFRAYEALTGNLLLQSGFLKHDTLMIGASLDGHSHDFRLIVEAKCPIPATHWEYVRSGVVPLDYYRQIQHQAFVVPECEQVDFLSHHPDFPIELRTKVVSLSRTDLKLDEYEKDLVPFLNEVDNEESAILTMMDPTGVLKAVVEATSR